MSCVVPTITFYCSIIANVCTNYAHLCLLFSGKTIIAELASSSDEHDKVHEVGNETGDDNKLPSSVAEDAVQDEISGSADMDSQIIAGSSEAENNDSTVATIADSQIPFDPSDKDTLAEDGNGLQREGTTVDVTGSKEDDMEAEEKQMDDSHLPAALQSAESSQPTEHAAPTEDDGNGLQSEGTSVDVAGSKEDNIEVEEKIDDISRGSSSHLPDVLQSTPNQHSEQECLDNSDDVNASVVSSHAPLSGPKFTCVKELEKADETLETSDAQVADEVCLQTNDGAHNMAAGSCSTLEDKNEDSSAQITDCEDLLLRKGATVDDLDGCVEGHSGLSTHSNDEVGNPVEIVKGMNDTSAGSEVHVDPESHVSDEVSMPVVPSDLKVELKNQSEPACQFGAVIVEESNVSLSIQTPALAESEEMTSGGFMHGMLFSFKEARMTVIFDPSNVYLPCSARVRRTGGVYSFVFPFC